MHIQMETLSIMLMTNNQLTWTENCTLSLSLFFPDNERLQSIVSIQLFCTETTISKNEKTFVFLNDKWQTETNYIQNISLDVIFFWINFRWKWISHRMMKRHEIERKNTCNMIVILLLLFDQVNLPDPCPKWNITTQQQQQQQQNIFNV